MEFHKFSAIANLGLHTSLTTCSYAGTYKGRVKAYYKCVWANVSMQSYYQFGFTSTHIHICDRISENGSKSHMKSCVFQHIFKCISTYGYVFPNYLLHNFDNLSIKFHVML